MDEIEFTGAIFLQGLQRLLDAGAVLIGPILAAWAGEHVFKGVKPSDFGQVPIVRRLAVLGGACIGLAALWHGLPGPGASVLSPLGMERADFALFVQVLTRTSRGFDPREILGAGDGADMLYRAGSAMTLAGIGLAIFYWRGKQAASAVVAAVLSTIFTAFAVAYLVTAAVWFVQLLNIWFIALAGFSLQKYRNLQSSHSR